MLSNCCHLCEPCLTASVICHWEYWNVPGLWVLQHESQPKAQEVCLFLKVACIAEMKCSQMNHKKAVLNGELLWLCCTVRSNVPHQWNPPEGQKVVPLRDRCWIFTFRGCKLLDWLSNTGHLLTVLLADCSIHIAQDFFGGEGATLVGCARNMVKLKKWGKEITAGRTIVFPQVCFHDKPAFLWAWKRWRTIMKPWNHSAHT